MRIGIDARLYSDPSDQWRFVTSLVHSLEKADTKNDYVVFLNEYGYARYTPKSPQFRAVSVSVSAFSLAEQTVWLSALYRERLDLMHFMGGSIPLGYFRPFVVTIQDLLPLFYPDRAMSGSFMRSYYRFMLRSTVSRARRITAVARHVARDLSEVANIEEESVEVIRLWDEPSVVIHSEDAKKLLRTHEIDRPYILSVGDITESANMVRLLEAIARTRTLDEHDLVIVGREDPVYHDVRGAMIRLGIQGRVHIIPPIDEKTTTLLTSGAKMVVSSAVYASTGSALQDALRLGTPVVCSDIPGFRETLGDRARYFRPLSIEGISETLEEMLAGDAPADVAITASDDTVRLLAFYEECSNKK